MDNVVARAKEEGFVSTIFGRRRYLNDISSHNAVARGLAERNAVNAPIRGRRHPVEGDPSGTRRIGRRYAPFRTGARRGHRHRMHGIRRRPQGAPGGRLRRGRQLARSALIAS